MTAQPGLIGSAAGRKAAAVSGIDCHSNPNLRARQR